MKVDLLIVGGGIAGVSSAVEAAEAGLKVLLVEREHWLGGRVLQMHRYFPKMCPPMCGLEINFRRLRQNPNITVLTGTTPAGVQGGAGAWKVSLMVKPRYVTTACTACGDCEAVCTAEVPDPFNMGMKTVKAVRLPHELAYPYLYLVDDSALSHPSLAEAEKACKPKAIHLKMEKETVSVEAAEIIWATGWEPYDAAKLDGLNFGGHPNIITNLQFERLTALSEVNGGQLRRPSDGKALESAAFVQCAGSRDEKHLPYCSAVCCMASLKQSRYIRELHPDAEVHIFFIDSRTPGRWEEFYQAVQDDPRTHIHRGKVAKVEPSSNGRVTLTAENTLSGKLEHVAVDLAVLAVGMQPIGAGVQNGPPVDRFGFYVNGTSAGVASGPKDVAAAVEEATGAVMSAMQAVRGRKS